jgi:hypothetical protein
MARFFIFINQFFRLRRPIQIKSIDLDAFAPPSRLLKNYLRCLCSVKNVRSGGPLKMLIYTAQTPLFRSFLPCTGCLENVFQHPASPQSTPSPLACFSLFFTVAGIHIEMD